MGLVRNFWGGIRARPRVTAAVALALAAGGFGGGWISASHVGAQKIAYTKGPALVIEAPATPAPPAFQAEVEKIAQGYREPVGIAVSEVAKGWTASTSGTTSATVRPMWASAGTPLISAMRSLMRT